ncbi:MAG: LamG domain-containing protein [Candidatus Saccharimonas sp.]
MRGLVTKSSVAILAFVISGSFWTQVAADRFTSSSYIIDASVMSNAGVQAGSTNYGLVGSAGESIVGNGASGSYKMGAGYVAQLEKAATQSLTLTVQQTGLAAYYPFDENSGTVAQDYSQYNNNGALQSGAGWTSGKIQSALAPGGVQQQDVHVPDSTALGFTNKMTVSLWAYQNTQLVSSAMVSQWDYAGGTSNDAGWALQVANNDLSKLRMYVATNKTDVGNTYTDTAVGTWSSGVWHHVVVVYDGTLAAANRVKIYIDGVDATGATVGTIPATLQNSAAWLGIGDFYGLNRIWNGKLDEVKLFNRSLTSDDIAAEYAAGAAGVPAGAALPSIVPGSPVQVDLDAIVRTQNVPNYSVAISQNHDLQKGADTIPAITSTIAAPSGWNNGTTKGFGFSMLSAPGLDSKWGSGANFAAVPGTATTFYSRSGATNATKDVAGLRFKVDPLITAPEGLYTNVLTVTGTILP